MKKKNDQIEILSPINQLNLYGYENYFDLFINLFNKGKIPNRNILSGQKGIGKATFSYHLINYLLTINEETKYFLIEVIIILDFFDILFNIFCIIFE